MNKRHEEILSRPTASVSETCEVIGAGRHATYEAINRGDIPSIRIGRLIRVPTASLKAMLGILPSDFKVA